jgi:hypothetical protein
MMRQELDTTPSDPFDPTESAAPDEPEDDMQCEEKANLEWNHHLGTPSPPPTNREESWTNNDRAMVALQSDTRSQED